VFVRVWRFVVRPEHVEAFVRLNGEDGDWARLFAQADGYLGTALEADAVASNTFRTTDRWRSQTDFAAFLERFGAEYRALDEATSGWTDSETLVFEGLVGDMPEGP
jgi:hypothetical protein